MLAVRGRDVMVAFSELDVSNKIGSGAAGSVWKGSWRGAAVAIKVLYIYNIMNNRCFMIRWSKLIYLLQTPGRGVSVCYLLPSTTPEHATCLNRKPSSRKYGCLEVLM